MNQVRLKRLRIENYRNVAPGTEFVFNDGFNVLLGRNGTGKTTLLKLIAMITKSNFSTIRDAPFHLLYELWYPGLQIIVNVKNDKTDSAIGSSQQSAAWSYVIKFDVSGDNHRYEVSASPFSGVARVAGSTFTEIPVPVVSPFDSNFFTSALGALIALMGHEPPGVVVALLAHLFMSSNGGRFDEALGGFEAMTSTTGKRSAIDIEGALVVFWRTAKNEFRSGGFSLVPLELWTYPKARSPLLLDGDNLRIDGTDLVVLDKITKSMGFARSELVLQLLKREQKEGAEKSLYTNFRLWFTAEDGSVIAEELLSYGQKRLLSFLYYAACNPDLVIADELVNGMHHAWVQVCVDEIAGRQAFLASQDPLLFDFLTFESTVEVERSFILCTLEMRDGHGQFVWRNLDPESAASFYRAYDAGIQHVSEILRTKGLW